MTKFKAVIFDMDGTMVESEAAHFNAYKRVLHSLGVELKKEDYWKAWGTDKEICQRLCETLALNVSWEDMLDQKNTAFRTEGLGDVQPKAGLFELLEKLHREKYLLAVASGSQMEEIVAILTRLDIKKYFQEIVSAESVSRGKPAPDMYLLAAKKLGVSPEDSLVVEDSPKGVQAAKAAGMTCFVIPTGETENPDISMADKVLKNLGQVYEEMQ